MSKSNLDKRQTPFAFPLEGRSYGSRSSSASFTYFHYVHQNFQTPTNTSGGYVYNEELVRVEQGYVDDEISSVKISKSISQPSGNFSISLLPSKNWKQIISPGDWIIIYFQDDFKEPDRYKYEPNNKNLMMLANVDRISRSLQKNPEDDKVELRYVISGRGFGKAFEETDIWFDPYAIQNESLNRNVLVGAGMQLQGSPDEMVSKLMNVFLGDGANFTQGRIKGLANWKIPLPLLKIFGLQSEGAGDAKLFDILTNRIQEKLLGYKTRQMFNLNSNGSLYDLMKRNSNQLVNELYFEEVRTNSGKIELSVILKPRPTNTPFISAHLGNDPLSDVITKKLEGNYNTLQKWSDENYVEISNAEIIYEDMGKDDHSRMNTFWLRPVNNFEHQFAYAANNNETVGISNPTFIAQSIERHGLKRFDQVLEFCHTVDSSGNMVMSPEINLWKTFLIQLYDMHYANHLYEAGTIECTGVLEAELGKALIILPTNTAAQKKVYLIEGYEHDWSFPGKWTTKFTLTHGQWKTNDTNIFIDVSEDDYGAPDTDIDTIYLAKTEASR